MHFTRTTTNERVDVDTSSFSSVELERAREVALSNSSMYKHLGGDNPSPLEKAFGEFLDEYEASTCGGPRTAEQFVNMIKHLPKQMTKSDLETWYRPRAKKAQAVRVSSGMPSAAG